LVHDQRALLAQGERNQTRLGNNILQKGFFIKPKVETAIRGYREKILFDYDLVKEKYAF